MVNGARFTACRCMLNIDRGHSCVWHTVWQTSQNVHVLGMGKQKPTNYFPVSTTSLVITLCADICRWNGPHRVFFAVQSSAALTCITACSWKIEPCPNFFPPQCCTAAMQLANQGPRWNTKECCFWNSNGGWKPVSEWVSLVDLIVLINKLRSQLLPLKAPCAISSIKGFSAMLNTLLIVHKQWYQGQET